MTIRIAKHILFHYYAIIMPLILLLHPFFTESGTLKCKRNNKSWENLRIYGFKFPQRSMIFLNSNVRVNRANKQYHLEGAELAQRC